VGANLIVVRAYSGATFGSRSAQVWRRQVQVRRRKRRTMKRSSMGAVGQGARVAAMDASGRLATIGPRGTVGDHRSHQDETRFIDDQGLKLEMVIEWQQIRAQIV
jgi:hypothetical protein